MTTMGLQAAGLKPIDLFEGEKDDYPGTREWALWIWQNMPHAQGLADQHAGRRCADSRGGCRSLADPDLAGPGRRGSRRRLVARHEEVARPDELKWPQWRAAQPDKAETSLALPGQAEHKRLELLAGRVDLRPLASGCALWCLDLRLADFDWRSRHGQVVQWYGMFCQRPPVWRPVGPSEPHGERYFDAALP